MSSKDATYGTPIDYCICGCGGSPCIPQREYEKQRTDATTEGELQEMISFSVNNKCGYPLLAALKKAYTGLDGRDDKVFTGAKSSISIRIEVSVTHRRDPTATLNSVFSGYHTRSGRDRLVPTFIFHCMDPNLPPDSNIDLEKAPRLYHSCEACD